MERVWKWPIADLEPMNWNGWSLKLRGGTGRWLGDDFCSKAFSVDSRSCFFFGFSERKRKGMEDRKREGWFSRLKGYLE